MIRTILHQLVASHSLSMFHDFCSTMWSNREFTFQWHFLFVRCTSEWRSTFGTHSWSFEWSGCPCSNDRQRYCLANWQGWNYELGLVFTASSDSKIRSRRAYCKQLILSVRQCIYSKAAQLANKCLDSRHRWGIFWQLCCVKQFSGSTILSSFVWLWR